MKSTIYKLEKIIIDKAKKLEGLIKIDLSTRREIATLYWVLQEIDILEAPIRRPKEVCDDS